MKVTRIFDLLPYIRANYGKPDVLGFKENGKWRKYNIHSYIEKSDWFSLGLLAMGIKPGDKIATTTLNRPEWNFTDMGTMQVGAVHVPIYPTLSPEEFGHVLRHSDTKILLVGSAKLYEKLAPVCAKIEEIKGIYTFDRVENAPHWSEIVELGKKNETKYRATLEKQKAVVKPSDVATLIYTSGTTGETKGVMLSHENLLSNAFASAKVQHLNQKHRVLSFLPLSHVFAHMVNYKYQYKGISIYYAEAIDKIADNVRELKVHGFITVPRLIEKIFDQIMAKGRKLSGLKKIIFYWALQIGFAYEPYSKQGFSYWLQHKIVDALVFKKWRKALSPGISFIGCGGAPLQPRLTRIFWAAGLPVFEGYGLTEASPIIAVNYSQPGKTRIGSVGPVLEGVEVKIAADGEILCKGLNVMLGYYKAPELTREVIDAEGWLHTGDIGVLDEGFLTITDRKKEIFKTSGGKYIAPQVLENKFKESPFIEQIMVVGENRNYPAALIIPDFKFLHNWCSRYKIDFFDNHDLIKIRRIEERIQREVEKYNQSFSQPERIKRFKLLAENWTLESGELTPTLKLRRKIIAQKYAGQIRALYKKT